MKKKTVLLTAAMAAMMTFPAYAADGVVKPNTEVNVNSPAVRPLTENDELESLYIYNTADHPYASHFTWYFETEGLMDQIKDETGKIIASAFYIKPEKDFLTNYDGKDLYRVSNSLIETDDELMFAADKTGIPVTNTWVYTYDNDLAKEGVKDYAWYYMQGNGKAKEDGFATIDGERYYFEDHKMMTGWIEDGDNFYYTNPEHDGTYGSILRDEWAYIDEFGDDNDREAGWYYFDGTGKAVKGKEKKIGDYYYVFDDDGRMMDGFVEFENKDGETVYKFYRPGNGDRIDDWFYVEANDYDTIGKDVEEDSWFYFKNGIMLSSDYKTTKISDEVGIAKVNGKYYGFNSNGEMISDFVYGYDDAVYYFDMATGEMKTGRVKIDENTDSDYADETFYFADKGRADEIGKGQTGVVKNFLYDHGQLQKADFDLKYEIKEVDGLEYFVDRNGKVMKPGNYKDGEDTRWHVEKDGDGYLIEKIKD